MIYSYPQFYYIALATLFAPAVLLALAVIPALAILLALATLLAFAILLAHAHAIPLPHEVQLTPLHLRVRHQGHVSDLRALATLLVNTRKSLALNC